MRGGEKLAPYIRRKKYKYKYIGSEGEEEAVMELEKKGHVIKVLIKKTTFLNLQLDGKPLYEWQ